MRKTAPAALVALLIAGAAWAQDEEEETIAVSTCSLSVKTTVYPPDTSDRAGSAVIEAVLCDKDGIPIPDQEIVMTATSGTFSCLPPSSYAPEGIGSGDRSCFITGQNGMVRVYLLDIPFNQPGRLKATCTYKDFMLKSSAGYSVTRNVIKRKTPRKKSGGR